MRYSTRRYGGRRSVMSRTGYGGRRRRTGARRTRSVRLVVSAPRGILPRTFRANNWARRRRNRRF